MQLGVPQSTQLNHPPVHKSTTHSAAAAAPPWSKSIATRPSSMCNVMHALHAYRVSFQDRCFGFSRFCQGCDEAGRVGERRESHLELCIFSHRLEKLISKSGSNDRRRRRRRLCSCRDICRPLHHHRSRCAVLGIYNKPTSSEQKLSGMRRKNRTFFI